MQNNLMHEAIQRIAVGPDRGKDISQDSAKLIMQSILQGDIDPVQTAVFLIALRMKRESIDEFRGLFEGLQSQVEQVTASVDSLTCLADPFDGYVRHLPMSPFIPAVLAACEMPALMHGVETVGPKHGVTAHKVYKLAGLPCLDSPTVVARNIEKFGWAYIDQSCYIPSLTELLPLRDKIIKRTAVTTLERILMPIKGSNKTNMVLGYVHMAYPEIYTSIAQQASYDNVLLVKGVEGGLTPGLNKPLRRFFVDCNNQDSKQIKRELCDDHDAQQSKENAVSTDLTGSEAVEACLNQGMEVLSGKLGVARDSLILAVANILEAHQVGLSFTDAVAKVENCLDNGKVKEKFLNLKQT